MVLGLLAMSTTVTVAQTDHSKNRQLWGSIATVPSSGAINYGDYTAANNKVLLTWRMLPEDTEAATAPRGFMRHRRFREGSIGATERFITPAVKYSHAIGLYSRSNIINMPFFSPLSG